MVMGFKFVAQIDQLPVKIRHFYRQFLHRFRCAYAGNHVFALRINQIFAVHFINAGAWIAGKADAGCAIIAHIAEHHGDDINGCAVGHIRRNMKFAPVIDGAFARP